MKVMMPMSHVYVATKVCGKMDPLLVFGSVLPDITTTSGKKIPREKIHDGPVEFYNFVKNKYPKLLDLAIGVKLHSSVLKGADYYSDDFNVGFAVREGKKIQRLVGELIESDNEEVNLVLAHNFIEAGVDINLLKKHSEIKDLYEKSVLKVNFGEISQCISDFAGVDKNMVNQELVKYCYWLDLDHMSSIERLTVGLIVPMISIRLGKTVEKHKVMEVLIKAVENTQDKTQVFLDEAVNGMKNNLKLRGL
jgi:hypothetical protein